MELKKLGALIARNMKCYFKDKFLFFVSLITPMILILLFVTFLRSVYIDSFNSIFLQFGFVADSSVVDGLAGAWLLSSVMSVCSVTVAVCSNAVMVQDRIDGTVNDFAIAPVKSSTMSVGYFVANFCVTLIVMLCTLCVGCVYLAAVGWYITAGDFLMILVDTLCAVLFGTLLAGVLECRISTQGALSALSTLVSGVYGFICGAYMPLSQFSEGMRNVLCFLPGTYSVGMLRNHFMRGYIDALGQAGLDKVGQTALADSFDANLYVGGRQVPLWAMYVILLGSCAVLFAVYLTVLLLTSRSKARNKRAVVSRR